MISLLISGILYECDGVEIRASANGQTFGPARVADAKVLENGAVYLVLGILNVVLTAEAFDILCGRSPLPEVLAEEERAHGDAATEQPTTPKRRTRRSSTTA